MPFRNLGQSLFYVFPGLGQQGFQSLLPETVFKNSEGKPLGRPQGGHHHLVAQVHLRKGFFSVRDTAYLRSLDVFRDRSLVPSPPPSVERMGRRPYPQVGTPAPVSAVMARTVSGARKIGYFVPLEPGRLQPVYDPEILPGRFVVVGSREFPPSYPYVERRPFFHGQRIGRNVLYA